MADSFCNPMNCSRPLPALLSIGFPRQELLEQVSVSFSKDLPGPQVKSSTHALAGGFFTTEPPRKPYLIFVLNNYYYFPYFVVEPELQKKKKDHFLKVSDF